VSPVWDDPRVARGLDAMLKLRRARLAAGERALGWKLAFAAPAARERLGIDAPVVGFLTDASLVDAGSTVSIAGWTRAVLEPEVAVLVGAEQDIAALAPAFELADLDRSLDDVAAILSENIFHRRVIVGAFDGSRRSLDGVEARVLRNGYEHARTSEPEALTGELAVLVRHVDQLLAAKGERLREADVLIAGSIVPPIAVTSGEEFALELQPIGRVDVRIG
jgi:2-keto-4-pentenoate hydratase